MSGYAGRSSPGPMAPLRPVPEGRPILPLGPRMAPAFPIASHEPRASMRVRGALVAVTDTLPAERIAALAFARQELASLLRWEHDGAYYQIFINPKELYEEALRLNDATQAMIRGEGDELTPWRILASPRIEQVMDTDTMLAARFVEALEPGPVSMGRALRAAIDFRADLSAMYRIVRAFEHALRRTLFHRPQGRPDAEPVRRSVILDDIEPLFAMCRTLNSSERQGSGLTEVFRWIHDLIESRVNRGFVQLPSQQAAHLRWLAEGRYA